MDVVQILKKLGFDEKDIRIYLILLSLGPSPVRKIAQASGINRGTTYDVLRHLIKQGLIAYYHKEKKQYFVAEDPEKLEHHLEGRMEEMRILKTKIQSIIPELQSLYNRGGGKPISRYYEGLMGVRSILQDLLATMAREKQKEYYLYSSVNLREFVHKSFPQFTRERIKRGIAVKVIALGEGGKEQALSERKWLTTADASPAYNLIYGSKTAHIALNGAENPIGVVVEDPNIARTQQIIFERLWATL